MTEIALLRHFPTAWNEAGRLQGRTDIPLSPASVEALKSLRLPDRWRAARLIASPLARAAATAEALAEGRPVATDPRLIELDLGAWEGRVGAELLADPASGYGPVEGWTLALRPPGGESIAEMTARLAALLRDLAGGPPTVLVAHRGVMRGILGLATGWEWEGPEPFRIRRNRLHPLRLRPDGTPEAPGPPEPLVPR